MKKKLFLLPFLFLFLLSCNPDDESSNTQITDEEFAENFGPSVSRDFIGQVVDQANHGLSGVTVKIGTSSVQTDNNGFFIINGASVKEKFAYITADKAGFISGSRSLVPTSGKNSVKIMLISSTSIATVSSGETAEVGLPNGTKVIFDGAFQTEDGSSYTGNVSVSMYHLEASNESLQYLMPGMLYAKGEDNQPKVLETFGMLNVELRGSAGQKLQIKSGHTAEISMMIDDSQSASAPTTIPLWHFDQAVGYWKQDGQATRQGNRYVGEVSHFSWWNCDAPFTVVQLCTRVTDTAGNPLAFQGVSIIRQTDAIGYAYTNENGEVCGLVPANEQLTIRVVNSICNEQIYQAAIGPFSGNTSLPDIQVGGIQMTSVQGTLVNCNAANVTNGYVVLKRWSYIQVAASVTNGSFEFNLPFCSGDDNQITLQGFDFDALNQTDSIQYTLTAPVTNVGNLMACNTVEEIISYQIDNEPTVYIVGAVESGTDGPDYMWVNGNNTNVSIGIYGPAQTPGVYDTSTFSIEGNDAYIHSGIPNDVTFNLTQFGPVGGWIDMTFSGTYQTQGNVTHTITGLVHVRRDN